MDRFARRRKMAAGRAPGGFVESGAPVDRSALSGAGTSDTGMTMIRFLLLLTALIAVPAAAAAHSTGRL